MSMTLPETRFAGNAVNDLSSPIAGLNPWSSPINVTLEGEGLTSDVSLSSTPETKDNSRILLTQSHNFNLPTGSTIIDQIEMNWSIKSQTDTVRYYFALFNGGFGTIKFIDILGSGSDFFLTFLGTPTQLGFPSITVSDIGNTFFGVGIVAHDLLRTDPTVQIDSVKISINFSGSPLEYNESNDINFAKGGILVSGRTFAKPFIIDFPGETEGGIVISGSHFVGGSQTMVGTGGAVISPNAEDNPHFETGIGGTKAGGSAYQTYNEIASGGLIAGGKAPNGTSDFGSGGVFVSGLGNLKVDFVTGQGGILVGGIAKAVPYFIDLPGETEGGLLLKGRAKTRYDETTSGGVIIPAIPGHFFPSEPVALENGGITVGGEAEVNPYFETVSGGVKVGTSVAKVEVIWIGLQPFSLFQGSSLLGGEAGFTARLNFFPEGGLVASGHPFEVTTVEDIAGGSIIGGSAIVGIEPSASGGIVINGSAINTTERNPSTSGGVVINGEGIFTFVTEGEGGVEISGEVDLAFKLSYIASGGVSVNSTAEALFALSYVGNGEIEINSTVMVFKNSFIYNPTGGVDINGDALNGAKYVYNAIVGDGFIIGGVSNTGIPTIFRAIRKPTGTIGRSLASDNIFKSEIESLLITTIPKNPVLSKGLSTKEIRLNKCQGAFVPPQLVNRQRDHLPTPKQEERNRSSQLAKSG